ncbi:hypothetical protein Ocin01_04508 [Orchesella cincta]|uniref:Uncharacterized protein n=1 Tax=Orchesella cincta TaxID=48709 RepID=A0A1D2NA98_ORCCI|nr:hypothetical protein Ocin01_04508 [Orchesella cincta]
MVKLLEPEEVPLVRGSLKAILTACFVSYVGYLLIGLWCLHIEFEDAAKEAQGELDHNAEDFVEPAVELSIALGLIIFSIFRLGLLGIFFFETDENINSLSTLWLAFSTFIMMVIYMGTCMELAVFYHAHVMLPPVIFICIALDFIANVMVLCRKTAFQ